MVKVSVERGVLDRDKLDIDTEPPQPDAETEVELAFVGHAVTIPAKVAASTGTEACMLTERIRGGAV